MPDLPDSMEETTEICSSNDNIFAIFTSIDADLPSLGPFSPAVSIDPEVVNISPPKFPPLYLSKPGSTDEQYSPESTSTIKASDNDLTVEAPSTAGAQFRADNNNQDQHEPPPAYSFSIDGSRVLLRPNQFKHRVETANLVKSRKESREHFASRPTAINRPRINSRLRYSLKPEFDSWETVFRDKQRKQLTIENTSLPSQRLVVPLQAVTFFSIKTLARLLFKTQSSHFFPPEPHNKISASFQRGELSCYRQRPNLTKDAIF